MIKKENLHTFIKKFPPFFLFGLAIMCMELILRLVTGTPVFHMGLLFTALFSMSAGMFISGLCFLFRQKGRTIMGTIAVILLFVLYAAQITYHLFFGRYLIVYSLLSGGVTQVVSGHVIGNAYAALFKAVPFIMILVLVPIGFLILNRQMQPRKRRVKKGIMIMTSAVMLYAGLTAVISILPDYKMIQSEMFDMNTSVGNFGLLHSEILDIKYNLLGFSQKMDLAEDDMDIPLRDENSLSTEETSSTFEDETTTVIDRSPNTSTVDFAALAEQEQDKEFKELNQYFAQRQPTNKNEYTGMYKGYNLIHIVAEGFSPYAIDPVLTPTLYKMQQEGFQFNNFYTPLWGVSTSDGEYVACTGLLPKPGVWSFYRSGKNYMPYCLGNMFESIGMEETYAYHNNSHSYYHRDVSHPNMGYHYTGMGTGIEEYVKNCWPQSDLEMIAGSVSDYLTSDKQFHAYYMTVSGHMEYTRMDNMMSYQNWDAVKDLECSEALKAYYACNIEFDKAIAKLLEELNLAGVADKTVISITPDHHPYGLEKSGKNKYAVWEELLGHEVDTKFELYESVFLLYCQGTENPPVIDKYCYHADIIPTLLNLFGFEYDSRLLAGSDILSDSEGLVVFPDGSFITDQGTFDSSKSRFVLFDENSFSEEALKEQYVLSTRKKALNLLKISAKILETDYYAYVFK
ncbi:MAG: LTA synthase family protein [Lachnospiraceae bacterium]|nr:LTA synthase family protein [Lachnospiraceae bacterium]